MQNPLDGILPDFSIFGAEFTQLWQKLLAGLWGLGIILAVVFLIISIVKMASASSGGNGVTRSGTATPTSPVAAAWRACASNIARLEPNRPSHPGPVLHISRVELSGP